MNELNLSSIKLPINAMSLRHHHTWVKSFCFAASFVGCFLALCVWTFIGNLMGV